MITRTKGFKIYNYSGMDFGVDIPATISWDNPINVLYFFKGKGGKEEKINPYAARQKLVAPYLGANNTIAIYPEAKDKALGWKISGVSSTTDIGNIYGLHNLLLKDLEIVSPKVFGFGISNGGCFVHLLATQLSLFNKIGVAAANLWQGHPKLKAGTSIIHFHGELDKSVPYNGGIAHNYLFTSTQKSILEYVASYSSSDLTKIPSTKVGYNSITIYKAGDKEVIKLVTNSKAAHNILSLSTPQYDYMKELFKFLLS